MSDHWDRCPNCRFWWVDKSGFGQCRRFPPTPTVKDGRALWPVTSSGDWCGEWSPASQEQLDHTRAMLDPE